LIKVLRSGLNSLAFSTESLNLYPLPAGIADSLSSDEIPTSKDSQRLVEHDRINDNPAGISRLVLLIAQTCNLKCSYCFAKAYMGSGSHDEVMSPATARAAIERVFKSVPHLPEILFFGGEPLIGFATIKEAVQASKEYCAAHQARIPAFAITTNGTLIDQEVIEFFRSHRFSVTISLDGPPHINDKQRQFPSGRGTYDIVKKNIDLLRNAGIEINIEAVFTDNHTNCEETIESTYEFLLKLGPRDICLTPAIGGSPDECLDGDFLCNLERSYTSSTERIMDSWLTDSPMKMPYLLDMLDALMYGNGKTRFCGAGYDGITVDFSGKVFPCYTLMGNSLYMGSVYDKMFPSEDFRRVTALMRQTSKDSFSKCVKCWAKKLCSPCYGDTFAACGTLSAPRETICVIVRSVAKAILLKVAEFMSDEEKWNRFVENVNRLCVTYSTDCINTIAPHPSKWEAYHGKQNACEIVRKQPRKEPQRYSDRRGRPQEKIHGHH
jgi:uncharacterized protein